MSKITLPNRGRLKKTIYFIWNNYSEPKKFCGNHFVSIHYQHYNDTQMILARNPSRAHAAAEGALCYGSHETLFGSEKSPLSTSMSHWLKCIQLFPLCAFALSHPKWRQLPYLTALPAALSKTPILTVMLQATAIFCHTPALQTRGFTP